MSQHDIILQGCTIEPLMGYLKALGVLRIVSEQKDESAKGCWENGVFVLRSTQDEEGLIQFFLDNYQPTPIVVPWSGGDFFKVQQKKNNTLYSKTPTSTNVIESFLASSSERLALYRETLERTLRVIKQMGIDNKKRLEDKRLKSIFIARLRTELTDQAVSWIDACAMIDTEKPAFNSLLGSGGGSDGNTHFSDNFMQNLWEVFIDFDLQRKKPTKTKLKSEKLLRTALLGSPSSELVPQRTSSLFDAGAVGGPNAGQGFERISLGNPWGFILCIEGTLLLAGSISRRQSAGERILTSFPFQVRVTATGTDSAVNKESAGRELWLPLWHKPVGVTELKSLFSEGRATIRRNPVIRGVDFARAVASLGIDRGIDGFVRYAIIRGRVGGENYNTATTLGHFEVRARPAVDLIREVDQWLKQFRRAASDDKAPPRFKSALQQIDSSIFAFCQYGGASRFAEILCSLGQAEKELAQGEKFRKDNFIKPLSGLSTEWLQFANDNGVEFEIALALAGIHDTLVGPLRSNIEPVAGWNWKENNAGVAWASTDLATNLLAVLERRLIDGERLGCSNLPLTSQRGVSLNAISAFIVGEVNDERIIKLLWGMLLINHTKPYPKLTYSILEPPPLPRVYALLKLLFHSQSLQTEMGEVEIRPEPSVLPLLRAARIGEASTIAIRRLCASGLIPMPYHMSGRPIRDGEWQATSIDHRRLAAALLIPLANHGVETLAKMVLRPKNNTMAVV